VPSARRTFGRPGILIAAVPIAALGAITMAVQLPSANSQHAARCVRRTAHAKPPPRLPPRPTRPKRKTAPVRPVGGLKGCPAGQVPVIVAAKQNVPKGNPLIGRVGGSTRLFFGSPRRQRRLILKAVLPFRKVYPRKRGTAHHRFEAFRSGLGPGCNGVMQYSSCYYYGSAGDMRKARGGGTTMRIAKPAYNGSGGPGHSLDEIAVQGGTSNGNIVELGWNVSTAQYGNANPHLFVFHWIGWAPTCYDTCGWHQYSSTYAPGKDLGALVGHDVYVGWVYYQGNWWSWFDNQWLGYFPGSEWPAGYTSSSVIQWFGEVSTLNGTPPHTDMGTGTLPPAAKAARNATLCDVDLSRWVCFYYDQQGMTATFPAYYDIAHTGFGEVRYGGPGE
jgi:hypothetical protein